MKSLDDYLKKSYKMELLEDPDEGGFVVSYPELPGCVSVGETVEEAINNAADAKRNWMLACIEDGFPIPEPETEPQYSGKFKLRIPKSLHKSLANQAKLEGISMNQLCVYLLSLNFDKRQRAFQHSIK